MAVRRIEPRATRRDPETASRPRLLCLPYAGGSAAAFRDWRPALATVADVVPVQLPGRGERLDEPPFRRLEPLVADLAARLGVAADGPFALFGHSMGALVAFELARHLRRTRGAEPCHLFVSAFRAPQMPAWHPPVAHLPDDALLAAMYGAETTSMRRRQGFLCRMLPGTMRRLRADVAVVESYVHRVEAPLACPITVFGGLEDPLVRLAELDGWRRQTGGRCDVLLVPGGHFFVTERPRVVRARIARALRAALPAPPADGAPPAASGARIGRL